MLFFFLTVVTESLMKYFVNLEMIMLNLHYLKDKSADINEMLCLTLQLEVETILSTSLSSPDCFFVIHPNARNSTNDAIALMYYWEKNKFI